MKNEIKKFLENYGFINLVENYDGSFSGYRNDLKCDNIKLEIAYNCFPEKAAEYINFDVVITDKGIDEL